MTNSVYVIGDIHGCYDELHELYGKISKREDFDQAKLIFVGDYIDRGPKSAEVVEFVNNLQENSSNVIALRGNHEQMLLDAVDDRRDLDMFLYNGGYQTMTSYEYLENGYEISQIRDIVGQKHYAWFKQLKEYYEYGNIAVAHAGINKPHLAAGGHTSQDLLWSRDLRKFPHNIYRFTVHGHTPMNEAFINPNVAYIDTGAVFGGSLTCLHIPDVDHPNYLDMELIQVKRRV